MNLPWDYVDLFNIMKQLLESLDDVKNAEICHRNIKPSNVVYNLDSKSYKLTDFARGKNFNYD